MGTPLNPAANGDSPSSSSRLNGNAKASSASGFSNGTRRNLKGTNGFSSVTNGSDTNGGGALVRQPSYFGHDREEVTRILIQALSDLGYQTAADSVSQQSGFVLENNAVSLFRSAVLDGRWAEAEELLKNASRAGEAGGSGNALILSSAADLSSMQSWLRQQKFLELLEQQETTGALAVLRREITPLSQDSEKLHFLSSLLMCRTPEELMAKAAWDGAHGESRKHLLSTLTECISPSVMLPENRLAVLLNQVKQAQIATCLYHSEANSPSLYSDHSCPRHRFPTHLVHELKMKGEVWQVQFAHRGTRLAACGSTGQVVLWNEDFSVHRYLQDHTEGVGNISWSPDDTMLVTCCQDRQVRLYNTEHGHLVKDPIAFSEPVSACVWSKDSKSFVVGTLDRERSLVTLMVNGDATVEWGKRHRVQDLCGSPDGQWLVAVDDLFTIHVYNAVTRQLVWEMKLSSRPTSVCISADSKHLLVNKQDNEAQLFDLRTQVCMQKFLGHTGGPYLIRTSFGGANESFVVSGSDDGNILIWHKTIGAAVERLPGHDRCNSVSWCPSDPTLLASCGDDEKVKIWSSKSRASGRAVKIEAGSSV